MAEKLPQLHRFTDSQGHYSIKAMKEPSRGLTKKQAEEIIRRCNASEKQQNCIRELLPYTKGYLELEKSRLTSNLVVPKIVKKIEAVITKAEEILKG